jgi:hypothetical protein
MKWKKFVVFFCMAFTTVATFSQAEDLNKTILANETKVWNTFLGAHPNVQAFEEMILPDYLCIEATGKLLTKADNIDQLNHLTFSGFEIQDPQVRKLSPSSALIVARVRFKAAAGAQDISGETYTSTVWVKRDGKWLAQLHTETFKK